MLRHSHIVAVAVDKGGTGKTTTTANLSAGLARVGYRCLLVDADQQANLTSYLAPGEHVRTLYDSVTDEHAPLAIYQVGPNLDIVPASSRLFGVGTTLISRMVIDRQSGVDAQDCRLILRRILANVRQEYDYIIIDCPPSDNLMMVNALMAADAVIIVAKPEPFCVAGVQHFITMLDSIQVGGLTGPEIAGILITDAETNSVGHRRGEEALRAWAPSLVYDTKIRHSRPIYNAVLSHQDIYTYSPDSIGAQDYGLLVREFLKKMDNGKE